MGGFCCCRKSNRKSVINQALIPNEPLIEEKLNTTDAVSIPISDNNLVPNNKDNNIIKTELKEEKPSDDSNTIYSEKGLNLNENIGDDEPLLKANSPLICDYEKERITFTKNGLINLFDKLWVLDNYKCVYDKDNLIIDLRYEGTPMNQKFYLIRMVYKLKKAELKYNKDTDSMM